MILTGITACDHRAYLDNMQQRVPSLRYTMQTTRNWTPNSVIGAGCDAPAMRSNDGRRSIAPPEYVRYQGPTP